MSGDDKLGRSKSQQVEAIRVMLEALRDDVEPLADQQTGLSVQEFADQAIEKMNTLDDAAVEIIRLLLIERARVDRLESQVGKLRKQVEKLRARR